MSRPALAIVAIAIFLLVLRLDIGTDGEHVIIHSQADLVFLKSGQLRLHVVGVVLLPDINAETVGKHSIVH